MPEMNNDVLSWATDLEDNTRAQAERTARLDVVHKPVALMPDAHLGMGATVGSVIATEQAIVPAAVGVDIGCGMIAQKTNIDANEIDSKLGEIHKRITKTIPSGQPKRGNRGAGSHKRSTESKDLDRLIAEMPSVKSDRFNVGKVAKQFSTLGGGNHFVELTIDESDTVWIVLHSGSRGPGNLIAQEHIGRAKKEMAKVLEDPLEDPDLSYFVEGTPGFQAYVDAMLWAQDYAFKNRTAMMTALTALLTNMLGRPVASGKPINCHHNYAVKEEHFGTDLWVTRKGAINAAGGVMGIIPGSMATGSFIVEGKGQPDSYMSASHGAGRAMSRSRARRELSSESLTERMGEIAWNNDPERLLDEHPEAYKDLNQVMANQADLVEIKHRLTTILNYKGT